VGDKRDQAASVAHFKLHKNKQFEAKF